MTRTIFPHKGSYKVDSKGSTQQVNQVRPARLLRRGARRSLTSLLVAMVAAFGFLFVAPAFAQGSDLLQAPPPAPYVNVSTLLPLPDFIPTVGALYVDPANAPVGPYLAYGSDGSLVEVLFMTPLSEMEHATEYADLASGLLAQLGMNVDHVDITYNAGHPGMAEPHYHFRIVFVDHATQGQLLAQ